MYFCTLLGTRVQLPYAIVQSYIYDAVAQCIEMCGYWPLVLGII